MKQQLPPGHIVATLVSEHELILGFLEKLDSINKTVQQMNAYDQTREDFKMLAHIAEHLAEAELHHQREEQILFPELEVRGVYGPPAVMRAEHEQLRKSKQRLKNLAAQVAEMEFSQFKEQLDETVRLIVPTLREHIFKENNILYPTALKLIEDEKVWQRLKEACDKIGYCCFTPESQR
jgi:hypothetical protein